MIGVRIRKGFAILSIAGCLMFLNISRPSFAQKMNGGEVLARHLESLGSAKARAAITTRIMSGTSQVIFRTTPTGQAGGKAGLASQGIKKLVRIGFPHPVLPGRAMAYN